MNGELTNHLGTNLRPLRKTINRMLAQDSNRVAITPESIVAVIERKVCITEGITVTDTVWGCEVLLVSGVSLSLNADWDAFMKEYEQARAANFKEDR